MNTVQTDNALASRLDLGEVTSWRLHWLLCDLWSIQRDIEKTNFGTGVAQLHDGPYVEVLNRAKRVQGSYERLRWECKTMLGMDYEDEVAPLFAAIPKHAEYAAELAKTKTLLQGIVDKALEAEKKQLHSSIHSQG